MIAHFDKNDTPDLKEFPSAQIHGEDTSKAVPSGSRYSLLRLFTRVVLYTVLLGAAGLSALYLYLSRGPVSSDQLRTQLEHQISALLGPSRSVKIADARVAIGKSGLMAINAHEIQLSENGTRNLGYAGEVNARIKLLPLLSGTVEAKSIQMVNGALAISDFIENSDQANEWPSAIDFQSGIQALGDLLVNLTQSVETAGLEAIVIQDTKLIGFDQLGFRSQTGRVVSLSIEKDVQFQRGLFLNGTIETDHTNLDIKGSWKLSDQGGHTLRLTMSGLDVREFLFSLGQKERGAFYLDSPLAIEFEAPFDENNQPLPTVLKAKFGSGNLKISQELDTRLSGAELNLKLLPGKNQIELEQSPIKFKHSSAVLIGGLRFPKNTGQSTGSSVENLEDGKPIFELIANEIVAFGNSHSEEPARGNFQVLGWVEPEQKIINAKKLVLTTKNGVISGSASVGLQQASAALQVDISTQTFSIDDFKQLWPDFFAPGARRWAREGISEGVIKNAWVKADIPYGIFGNERNGKQFAPEHIIAHVPIEQATVKTVGHLPYIVSAKGLVRYSGMETDIQLESGQALLASGRKIGISAGTMDIADYRIHPLPAKLKMKMDGSASALIELGALDPLDYSETLGLKPKGVDGTVNVDFSADINLVKSLKTEDVDWKAKVLIRKGSTDQPILGRQLSKADLNVLAEPGIAKIEGSALVDGVPAKLALTERFGASSKNSKRSVLFVLDDEDRRKIGLDTGGILSGPIDVRVTGRSGRNDTISADLTRAKLDLPWFGWSKGKGIKATADFVFETKGGERRIRNLVLKGGGFSAKGNIVIGKSGIRSVDLSRVVLNKNDNFAIKVTRSKSGFDISMNARTYDARALIRSFTKSSSPTDTGGKRIRLKAKARRLIGFGGQSLSSVKIDLLQDKGRTLSAKMTGKARGGAPASFSLLPSGNQMKMEMYTQNAGSVLKFLDIYGKVQGGNIQTSLLRDRSGGYRGTIKATDFFLLNEPRLGQLLKPASTVRSVDRETNTQVRVEQRVDPRKAKISTLTAEVEQGRSQLIIRRGRLQGGDAGAAFDGIVYDKNNRINIKGTFLPTRGLNRAASRIPLLGLAFGKGKVNGLVGITFRLSGLYTNPILSVNPLSIIAPGVFRQLFKF